MKLWKIFKWCNAKTLDNLLEKLFRANDLNIPRPSC